MRRVSADFGGAARRRVGALPAWDAETCEASLVTFRPMHWRPAVPSVAGLIPARRVAFGALVALAVATGGSVASAQESGDAPGAPGGGSSWTTGDKIALGTASGTASPVWFTVANGIMTEVFYPCLLYT